MVDTLRRKKHLVIVASLVLFCLCFFWKIGIWEVSAAWVEQTVDGQAEYSRYPLESYSLDIAETEKGISAVGIWLMNVLANGLFRMSNIFSYFVGWVVGQAYQVDFIGDAIDFISGNIQTVAGVDEGGFRPTGLLPSFAPLLIVFAGGYFVWTGIFRRKTAQAAANLAAFALTFVLGMGVVAYSGSYLHMVNDFQKEFNDEIMAISSQITLGEESGDMVNQMRDNIFIIMIRNPYLMFQYGTSDIEVIGEERVTELIEAEPGSDERQEICEKEFEEYGNAYMGSAYLAERLGMCLVVLIVNLIVGSCILAFVAMIVMAQILFVLYMSFFPVALIFSMFPASGGRLRKLLDKCLDSILMRPGISLILTIMFSISMLCYRIAGTGNYLWAMTLQGIVFVTAFMKTRDLLGFMKIGKERGSEAPRVSLGRALMASRVMDRVFNKKILGTMMHGLKKGADGGVAAVEYGAQRINRSHYLKNAALFGGNVPESAVVKDKDEKQNKQSSVYYGSDQTETAYSRSSSGRGDLEGIRAQIHNSSKETLNDQRGRDKKGEIYSDSRAETGKGERRPGIVGRTDYVSKGGSPLTVGNNKGELVSRDHNRTDENRGADATEAGHKKAENAEKHYTGDRRRLSEQRRPGVPNREKEESIYRTDRDGYVMHKKPKGSNFEQRQYKYDELERRLYEADFAGKDKQNNNQR